jgi:hypothetical protein
MDFKKLFRRDSRQTSIDAALSIAPSLTDIQTAVLAFAKIRPTGFTDDELSRHFQSYGSTYRSRRAELTAQNLIVDSGKVSRLPSGRNATVWILADQKEQS